MRGKFEVVDSYQWRFGKRAVSRNLVTYTKGGKTTWGTTYQNSPIDKGSKRKTIINASFGRNRDINEESARNSVAQFSQGADVRVKYKTRKRTTTAIVRPGRSKRRGGQAPQVSRAARQMAARHRRRIKGKFA